MTLRHRFDVFAGMLKAFTLSLESGSHDDACYAIAMEVVLRCVDADIGALAALAPGPQADSRRDIAAAVMHLLAAARKRRADGAGAVTCADLSQIADDLLFELRAPAR